LSVPVALSSIFRPDGAAAEYGRVGNPSWRAFEEAVGALEGGEALAFGSGMAAAAAVIETLPPGARVVAPDDCYHGVRLLLRDLESRHRLRARLVRISEARAVLAACADCELLWIESPTNPLMRIADIAELARGADEMGLLVAVDNTFATPLLQRPLELGADVVVHSVSKLLAGHSDLVMGAVVTRDEQLLEQLRTRRTLHGGIPGPMEAFLALRGLRTLALRLERSQASAAELAQRLEAHPAVSRVHYPGLPSSQGHELASRHMDGFGSLVSFELAAGPDAADRVCRAVRLAVHATSLGGVETLIDRRARWPLEDDTPESLLRLSVGCEHVDDLWADLQQALHAATPEAGAA
jgi:cystathionine gamma-synthase